MDAAERERERRREQLRKDQERRREALKAAPAALAQGLGNFARFLKENPESGVKLGGLFTDAGGIAEAFGYYPDPFNEGEFLPSVVEQAKEGDYLGAGLTSLGAIPLVGLFARGLKGARLVDDVIKYEKFGDSSVKLDADPWIVQPFEVYEEIRIEEIKKKHQK